MFEEIGQWNCCLDSDPTHYMKSFSAAPLLYWTVEIKRGHLSVRLNARLGACSLFVQSFEPYLTDKMLATNVKLILVFHPLVDWLILFSSNPNSIFSSWILLYTSYIKKITPTMGYSIIAIIVRTCLEELNSYKKHCLTYL